MLHFVPNHKIEILYAILGCFTNLSIEGKSRRIVIVYKDSSPKLKKSKYYLLLISLLDNDHP